MSPRRSFDAQAHALPHIAQLQGYVPGEQPAEAGQWVKLNTNENPYPPSPMVVAAIQNALDEGEPLRLYPNPTAQPLREAIARAHGLEAGWVLAGNGSDDVLNLFMRAFCGEGRPAGMCVPSYSLYPVLAAIQGAELREVPFTREMVLEPEAVGATAATVFFLTSPNAPTGVAFANETIARAAEALDGLLVVDEAYAPYADGDATGLLDAHANVAIVRSLSKSHALAGLRTGYVLARPEVIAVLDKVRDSYNLDRLAQAGAAAALGDPGYTNAILGKIRNTRDYYRHQLQNRGWFTYASQANFIFTEPVNARGERGREVAEDLYGFLYGRKILVRHFPKHALTAPFVRISVGTEDEMEALSDALDVWQQPA